MKYVKTFESFSINSEMTNEEFLGFGPKTYILKSKDSSKEFKPSDNAQKYIKFEDGKAIFTHPASKVCYKDFSELYKKKFNKDLTSEAIVKSVQAVFDFAKGAPMLSKYDFEYNDKDGNITLKVNPNGKGLFSGTGVTNW